MFRSIFLVPLAMVFQGGFRSIVDAQQEPATHHVRVEITTSGNGKTDRVVKEFDVLDDADIQDSLREWGVAVPDGEEGAYLGVSTASVNDGGGKGALVVTVIDGTPAEKAGLKEGDVITKVDGKEVDGPSTFAELIRGHEPDDVVKLTCLREGRTMSLKATLTDRPSRSYSFDLAPGAMGGNWNMDSLDGAWSMAGGSRAFLGVTPGDDDGTTAKGAAIGSVEPGSAADSMGIRGGDIITRIGTTDIADFQALSSTVGSMEPGDAIAVTLLRDGRTLTLNGQVGKRPDAMAWAFNGHGLPHAPEMRNFRWEGPPMDRGPLQEQIDRLQEEVDQLREYLGGAEEGRVRRGMRMGIGTTPLSQDEKDLLKSKGVGNLDKELQLEDVRLFPDPSPGPVHLRFGVPKRGDLTVDIHDATGERTYHETISAFKGEYDRTLDLSDKPPGSYFVVIAQNGRVLTRKLVRR
jgi:type II secretory pathway component PulC